MSIKEYVDRQAFTAAVEKFSDQYDKKQIQPGQKKYVDLIPSKNPQPHQQYAFEVDLDKCTGCKACVSACHHENGLDEDETWRSVGLVQGGTSQNPAIQHITTACHHCLEPACMTGCPTLAYTKDPTTGIVKHLDDQCFGCQYCILKCPYDVPKYNKKRGIVHKCDMCIGRLSAGQAPACVRACPNGAIRITLVDKKEVLSKPSDYVNVPDAPASTYTKPTTRYITNRVFPENMESVDYHSLKPEHSHMPLVIMLVLTQLSVGAFAVEFFLRQPLEKYFMNAIHIPVALGIGLLALASSIFHLGRPHLAFRAVLGFRKSWLSREIIAFGAFANMAIFYAISFWIAPLHNFMNIIALSVIILGVIGILCSVMVYRDTKRPFWDNPTTGLKFLMTSMILGSATTLLTYLSAVWINGQTPQLNFIHLLSRIIVIVSCMKLFLEATIFASLYQKKLSFLKKTAILMTRQLNIFTRWRFLCGCAGGILLPVMILNEPLSLALITIGSFCIFGLTLAAELLERYLFFRAVVPLKMPGGEIS